MLILQPHELQVTSETIFLLPPPCADIFCSPGKKAAERFVNMFLNWPLCYQLVLVALCLSCGVPHSCAIFIPLDLLPQVYIPRCGGGNRRAVWGSKGTFVDKHSTPGSRQTAAATFSSHAGRHVFTSCRGAPLTGVEWWQRPLAAEDAQGHPWRPTGATSEVFIGRCVAIFG